MVSRAVLREAGRKLWVTRRENEKKERFHLAAVKAWATRKANEAALKTKQVEAGRKSWVTRRYNMRFGEFNED